MESIYTLPLGGGNHPAYEPDGLCATTCTLEEEDTFNKHQEIIKTIDSIETTDYDPNDPDELGPDTRRKFEDFLTKESLQDYLQKPDEETNSTLLHKLSLGYTYDGNGKNRDFAAKYLLKKYPQLLHTKEDTGEKTPLGQAVENCAADFAGFILMELQPTERVRALTETANAEGFTCLTLAIKLHMGLNYDVVNALLYFSDPVVLVTPDKKGNTPLHYLVQSSEFSPKPLMHLLKTLLEKGPEAMNITNTEKETPYQARQRFLRTHDKYCVVKISPAVNNNGHLKVRYRFKGFLRSVDHPVRISDEVSELMKTHLVIHNFRIEGVLYKPDQGISLFTIIHIGH